MLVWRRLAGWLLLLLLLSGRLRHFHLAIRPCSCDCHLLRHCLQLLRRRCWERRVEASTGVGGARVGRQQGTMVIALSKLCCPDLQPLLLLLQLRQGISSNGRMAGSGPEVGDVRQWERRA
jgi:hypothetical protein